MTTAQPREPRGLVLVVVLLLMAAGTVLMLSVPADSRVVDLVYGRF